MRHALALLALVLVASCVGPPAAPPPPAPRPAPSPPPPPPPALGSDWRDWPLTPGTWRYGGGERGSAASYGGAGQRAFAMTCNRGARMLTLAAVGAPPEALTIRTSSTTRTLRASGAGVALPANDPLLDAIAFSRGRFVVERAGAAPLVLPTWAEIGRVIEDCRG